MSRCTPDMGRVGGLDASHVGKEEVAASAGRVPFCGGTTTDCYGWLGGSTAAVSNGVRCGDEV